MSKKTLYLIRHAEAEGNITNRTHGLTDTPLTPRGRGQLPYLRERFSQIQLTAVYASELQRAQMTAAAVAEPWGVPVQTQKDLHEIAMGIFEDCTWYEMAARFPRESACWVADHLHYHIPKGESYIDAGKRMYRAVMDILEKDEGDTVAAVSHAMAIRALLYHLEGKETGGYSENTAVTKIEYETEGKTLSICYENDSSHLPNAWKRKMVRAEFSLDYLQGYSLRYEPGFTPETVRPSGVIVGYQREKRVGALAYRAEKGKLYVEELFVEEGERRKGYASQLLGEAVYRGRRFDTETISITVKSENEEIRGFLQKNDFQAAGSGRFEKPLC